MEEMRSHRTFEFGRYACLVEKGMVGVIEK
jgi:hypothetical protein